MIINFTINDLLEYTLVSCFGVSEVAKVDMAITIITVLSYIFTFASLVGTYFTLRKEIEKAFHIWVYTNSAMLVLNVFVRDHQYAMGIFFFTNLLVSVKGYYFPEQEMPEQGIEGQEMPKQEINGQEISEQEIDEEKISKVNKSNRKSKLSSGK